MFLYVPFELFTFFVPWQHIYNMFLYVPFELFTFLCLAALFMCFQFIEVLCKNTTLVSNIFYFSISTILVIILLLQVNITHSNSIIQMICASRGVVLYGPGGPEPPKNFLCPPEFFQA